MRRPVIAGNWKMYKTQAEARAYFSALAPLVQGSTHCDIIVAPPFTAAWKQTFQIEYITAGAQPAPKTKPTPKPRPGMAPPSKVTVCSLARHAGLFHPRDETDACKFARTHQFSSFGRPGPGDVYMHYTRPGRHRGWSEFRVCKVM